MHESYKIQPHEMRDVTVVGVVMLHQTQVISSQINHLALAVLLGLAGYLLVFKKFYFLSSQIAGHSDQYNQAEVKWDKIAGGGGAPSALR